MDQERVKKKLLKNYDRIMTEFADTKLTDFQLIVVGMIAGMITARDEIFVPEATMILIYAEMLSN